MHALLFPALTPPLPPANMPTETVRLCSSEKMKVHLLSRKSLLQCSAIGCKEADVRQAWVNDFQIQLFTHNIAKSAHPGEKFY